MERFELPQLCATETEARMARALQAAWSALDGYQIHTPEKINAALASAQNVVNLTFPSYIDKTNPDQKALTQALTAEIELRKAAIATAFRRILLGQNPCPAATPEEN